MVALTAGELAGLQGTQEAHMMDTCQILAYGSADDTYNLPTVTYTAGTAIACGVEQGAGAEVQEETEIVLADVTIRLPLDTTVNPDDRIRITKRFGVTLDTPLDVEIVGQIQRGPSGLVVPARTATTPTTEPGD